MPITPTLNKIQKDMLAGELGKGKQMGMRLLLDMAAAANATELIPIQSAHLSGVSPLTGGLGLRLFLAELAKDSDAAVAVPTTLNAAGCDEAQFDEMRIVTPNFLEHSREIVALYTQLGVRPTQSCIPYEWEGVVAAASTGSGTAAWSESNAICFANSYCGLRTNRESGLSALACALTGYTPRYGLLSEDAGRPNLEVIVTAELQDPVDFSILGDWIGKQRKPEWRLPLGPIPLITGLSIPLSHEQQKALAAAAANYGCPLLYVDGLSDVPPPSFEATLTFGRSDLRRRYEELRPKSAVSLITIGCPQASIGELRATAELLRGKQVTAAPATDGGPPPLWIFTSSANKAISQKMGLAGIIEQSGALLLENTCPEVVPYDQRWAKHILTNSMKAEHYIKSGLNGIPTSVMSLADCIAIAAGELEIETVSSKESDSDELSGATSSSPLPESRQEAKLRPTQQRATGSFSSEGRGLPSQQDFTITGSAFVTDAPITFLGFVNRESGVIEEEGHPADGQSMAGKIAIFPRGSGSTVAPYVLLELQYRGMAPIAVANTDIDQQTAPACSLEGIPYAYGFDGDIVHQINDGDDVELRRRGEQVTLRVLRRSGG